MLYKNVLNKENEMRKNWKMLVNLSIVLLALVLLAGCGGKKDKEATTDNGKIKVVATV